MRPWWAPSVTATSLIVALAAAWPAAAADGFTPVERVLSTAAAFGAIGNEHAAEQLRELCGEDALCVAQRLVGAGDGPARLVQVSHPTSDTIRWVTTELSVTASRWLSNGARLIVLDGFGRKVVPELHDALRDKKPNERIVLDLRGNGGGDFGRMLEVAGLFIHETKNALYLLNGNEKKALDITPDETLGRVVGGGLMVLVGPGTASSGEILAALLRRYAGALLLGEVTAGKNYLYRVLPVHHDWRLLLPAEIVAVPGETIAGGLVPNSDIPAALASQIPAPAKEESAH